MKTLIAMALMVTSVAVMGDEVKEVKVEEPKAEVVTVPVEAIPSLTAEQIKEILKRDEERAKWIAERVKKEQEAAKENKEDKSPIVSQVVTVNEFFNHRTIECYVDDWVVVRLNAQDGNRWELGENQNGVVDLLMEYHNADGKKPRVISYEFDFEEEEAEIVEENNNKTETTRPVFVGMGNGRIRRAPRPQNEVYVFEFQAMKEGVEKITLNHIDTHMYIQMIGAPRPMQIPPFEIFIKVLPNEKNNVTDTIRVKGANDTDFSIIGKEDNTIKVKVGDTVEIALQNKTSTGFEWNNNDDINGDIIERIGYQYQMGQFYNIYKVKKAGKCMIDLTYMRPHEPNNFDLNRFYTLNIEAE